MSDTFWDMMKRINLLIKKFQSESHIRVITLLVMVRLILSIAISDGKVTSDGITYTGAALNMAHHGVAAAVLPRDETVTRAGLSFEELWHSLKKAPSTTERLLHFQWLHVLVLFPLLLLFPSLYTIIVVNTLFLAGAGFFLFRRLDRTIQIIGWLFLLFFPPFFLLTNNFFSEPLFLFAVCGIFSLAMQKKDAAISIVLFTLLLTLTRPIGILYAMLFIAFFVRRKQINSASMIGAGLIAAVIINAVFMRPSDETKDLYRYPNAAEAFYLSNSPLGNGDIDYYLADTSHFSHDEDYLRYRQTGSSDITLITRLTHQVLEDPLRFISIGVNKVKNMFFGIVPNDWIYGAASEQLWWKKILWSILTLTLWVLIGWGFFKNSGTDVSLYGTIALLTAMFHFFIVARYRYMEPVVALGLPYAASIVYTLITSRRHLK